MPGFGLYPSASVSRLLAFSLSEAESVKPAALRWCSTSLPTAIARTAKAPTAARTSFGCFQVRSAMRANTLAGTVPDFKVHALKFKLTAATIGLMGRREYDQPCSLACALDQIGERWSLLVVRELMLGPLRFSELARAVGGAPTDVLTRRLRDLEEAGVVQRVELEPPASVTAYRLTALGRGLERPLLELGRWGLNFHDPATVAEMPPEMLPNALCVTLRPPPGAELTIGLRSGDQEYRLRVEDGWIRARRGHAEDCRPDPFRHALGGDGDVARGPRGAWRRGRRRPGGAGGDALLGRPPGGAPGGRRGRAGGRRRYLSSAELLPSSCRATISSWICWVPSKMSRIFESRAHFSSRSCSA